MTKANPDLSRREFLRASISLSGTLVIGIALPSSSDSAQAAGKETSAELNAFLRIAPDNSVTVLVPQAEMGQGIATGLAMVVAEELNADWSTIKVEFATGRPEYAHPQLYKGEQLTAGSRSMPAFYAPMRKAAATARAMLITAGAERWKVKADECATANGQVVHAPSTRKLSFGALARAAAAISPPAEAALQARADWNIVGKPLKRLDTPAKTNGSAIFGMDVRLPDMLYAAVLNSPVLGAELASYNAEPLLRKSGVKAVVPLPGAVAVVAEHYWQAYAALRELEVTFGTSPNDSASTDSVKDAQRRALAADKASPAPNPTGDVDRALSIAAKVVEAEYFAPYLAHAPMEPANCTARLTNDGCELWLSSQAPTQHANAAATALQIDPAKVKVHMTYLGGGFGSKGIGGRNVSAQAALLAKRMQRPVQVIWSREQDMLMDYFRPAMTARLQGGLDDSGKLTSVRVRVAGGGPFAFNRPQLVKDGLDPLSIGGIADFPYQVANRFTDSVQIDPPVRVGFWRGTSNSQNNFFLEAFFDELAHAAGKDPYAFRRELLTHDARSLAVLDLAARKAGWGENKDGRYRGIAFMHAGRWETRVAQIVELSKSADALKIERIVCVVDSGLIINPNLAQSVVEGGVIFGLSAALTGEVTLKEGRVQQSNFHDYPVLRLNQVPPIEVHLIEGDTEKPGSFGEVAAPSVVPALVNAVFAATGKRVHSLPLNQQGVTLT
jgi:isoquinoline 1-oxidoreductase subunit beta